jgi:hypothetical protein
MLTALAVILIFVGGAATGGLVLYTIWRTIVTTPKHAFEVLRGVCETAGLGMWLKVDDKSFHLHCPKCGHSDRARPPSEQA